MKKTLFSGLILGLALLAFNSCAAIVGGGTYTAEVVAKDRENADIYYNGDYIGTGRAIVEIPRRQANNIRSVFAVLTVIMLSVRIMTGFSSKPKLNVWPSR